MASDNKSVQLSAFDPANPTSTVTVVQAPRPTLSEVRFLPPPPPRLPPTFLTTLMPPLQGEVLVRLTLRPVNPADIFSIMGVYPGFTPASFPAVPGLEGGPRAAMFQGARPPGRQRLHVRGHAALPYLLLRFCLIPMWSPTLPLLPSHPLLQAWARSPSWARAPAAS